VIIHRKFKIDIREMLVQKMLRGAVEKVNMKLLQATRKMQLLQVTSI
jgi:hypothetical protein